MDHGYTPRLGSPGTEFLFAPWHLIPVAAQVDDSPCVTKALAIIETLAPRRQRPSGDRCSYMKMATWSPKGMSWLGPKASDPTRCLRDLGRPVNWVPLGLLQVGTFVALMAWVTRHQVGEGTWELNATTTPSRRRSHQEEGSTRSMRRRSRGADADLAAAAPRCIGNPDGLMARPKGTEPHRRSRSRMSPGALIPACA
jgi:hypothetical protein